MFTYWVETIPGDKPIYRDVKNEKGSFDMHWHDVVLFIYCIFLSNDMI